MSGSGSSSAAAHHPQPGVRWSLFTDAPLKGLALAREVGWILLWDEADTLYLIDVDGKRLARRRAPSRLVGVAISDDGSLVVAAGAAGLWILDGLLMPRQDRALTEQPVALAVDALGHYLATSGASGSAQVLDHTGRVLARFSPVRPIALLQFVPGAALLLAAAHYGMAACYEVRGRHADALQLRIRWEDHLWSNAGGLAASGDGRITLIACFTHGIQRYRLNGQNEGAYHLAGSPARVAIDYDGRWIATITIEGDLQLLNIQGQVLWRHILARPALDMALDAQGRYLVYGLPTGEVTLVDLWEPLAEPPAAGIPTAELDQPEEAVPLPNPSRVRRPSWSIQAVTDQTQATTAVLALSDRPRRVVLFTNRNRLEFYNSEGQRVHLGPEMLGVGRMIRTAPGWIAGATDRQVVVYRGADDRSRSIGTRLVQITHFDLDPADGALVLVQERDRLTRIGRDGEAAWVLPLPSPVEDLAVGPAGRAAVTLDDGELRVIDRDGQVTGSFRPPRPEPLALAVIPEPPPVGDADEPEAPVQGRAEFVTLARRDQVVRGHDRSGRVLWQSALPLEAWALHRAGGYLVATAADGSAVVLDPRGRIGLRSREIPPNAVIFERPDGSLAAAYHREENLICSDLAGNVLWRHVADRPIGPLAAGRMGVACLIGYQLAVFLGRG